MIIKSAPEMTPVSYPNSKPPSADIRVNMYMNLIGFTGTGITAAPFCSSFNDMLNVRRSACIVTAGSPKRGVKTGDCETIRTLRIPHSQQVADVH